MPDLSYRNLIKHCILPTSVILIVASTLCWTAKSACTPLAPWLYFTGITALMIIHLYRIVEKKAFLSVTRVEWAGLVLVVLVAAAFRLHLITSFPFGVWFDEAANTLVSRKIVQDPSFRPVYVSDVSQLPAFWFYVGIPFTSWFDEGVLGFRMLSTIAGLLSVMAVWLLGRTWTPMAGFLAAFLTAVSRWHVTFSRFGMMQILTALFVPLVLFLLVVAVRHRKWLAASLAGILLGIGAQGYYPTLAIAGAAGITLLFLNRLKTGYGLRLIPVFLLAAFITMLPLISFATFNWQVYSERMRTVSSGGLSSVKDYLTKPEKRNFATIEPVLTSAKKHFRMFHFTGDANGRHNLPGLPMFDRLTGLFMGIGLLVLLCRLIDPLSSSLIVAAVVSLSAGIFSLPFEAPQAGRTISNAAVLPMIAGAGLTWLWGLTLRFCGGRRLVPALLLAIILVATAQTNWKTFFSAAALR